MEMKCSLPVDGPVLMTGCADRPVLFGSRLKNMVPLEKFGVAKVRSDLLKAAMVIVCGRSCSLAAGSKLSVMRKTPSWFIPRRGKSARRVPEGSARNCVPFHGPAGSEVWETAKRMWLPPKVSPVSSSAETSTIDANHRRETGS